ncbi:MAG: helix-turn-helix domain-containing protein [Synechococcaceae cyanobacterium SM1_2_3]|nr:helix-turn-helix domain-containing protein [Synechococcaceae cyanobacterium SM1_2_3]
MNDLLTTQQVADRLVVKKRTILRLHARRVLPYVRIGGSLRFPVAALEQWIAAQTVYPETGDCAGKPEELICTERKVARTGGSHTVTPAGERLSNLLKLPTAPKPRL